MRLIDAEKFSEDMLYDAELCARALDDFELTDKKERERLQFEKDCKQNCAYYATEQETANLWTLCSVRLPKEDGFWNTHGYQKSSKYVLVSILNSRNLLHKKSVTVGRFDYSYNKWILLYGNMHSKVIAWMPLPKPYEGD